MVGSFSSPNKKGKARAAAHLRFTQNPRRKKERFGYVWYAQGRRLRKPRIFVVYVKRRKRIEITIETLTLRSRFGNWLLWARSQPNHSREHADYSQGGGFPRP